VIADTGRIASYVSILMHSCVLDKFFLSLTALVLLVLYLLVLI